MVNSSHRRVKEAEILRVDPGSVAKLSAVLSCRIMTSRLLPRLATPLVLAMILAACVSPASLASGPQVGEQSAASADQRLTSLTALDERVARVAWRLMVANTELCPVERQSAGWALHSASQYSPALRPHALRRFGLEGDLPGVLAVPDSTPAEAAGVRAGDLITAVNGSALATGQPREAARFEGLAANVARLDRALSEGPTELTIRRDGGSVQLRVTPVRACGYDVQLNPSGELNARADGRRLFISTALAGFTQNDDELALILGHELAHNVLGHRAWSETGGEGRTVVERDCDPRVCVGSQEDQADRVGLFLMARAGYDPGVAAPFWRRFGESNWRVRFPQLAHASAGTRARRLETVQAEIEALVRDGSPVRP